MSGGSSSKESVFSIGKFQQRVVVPNVKYSAGAGSVEAKVVLRANGSCLSYRSQDAAVEH